jgi:hypothetical protein
MLLALKLRPFLSFRILWLQMIMHRHLLASGLIPVSKPRLALGLRAGVVAVQLRRLAVIASGRHMSPLGRAHVRPLAYWSVPRGYVHHHALLVGLGGGARRVGRVHFPALGILTLSFIR